MKSLTVVFALCAVLSGSVGADQEVTPRELAQESIHQLLERTERGGLQDHLSQSCCKICRAGQACGDSCISRDKTCRVGPGCACDG